MEYSEEEIRLFGLAQERSRRDDTEGVAEVLRKLVTLRPDSALFNATLANALNTLGEVDEAERLFRQAVSLAPSSEKISLGLFHCLWGRGEQDEALEEMKRFLSLADSDEYRLILAAVTQSLKDTLAQEPGTRARLSQMRSKIIDFRRGALSLNGLIQQLEALARAVDQSFWADNVFPLVFDLERINSEIIDKRRDMSAEEAERVEALVSRIELLTEQMG